MVNAFYFFVTIIIFSPKHYTDVQTTSLNHEIKLIIWFSLSDALK